MRKCDIGKEILDGIQEIQEFKRGIGRLKVTDKRGFRSRDGRYYFRLHWSSEDQEYVGLCDEFPSLSWLNPSPFSALKGIRKLVSSCEKDIQKEQSKIIHNESTS